MFDETPDKIDGNDDVELNEETVEDLDVQNSEGVVGGAQAVKDDATTNSCDCINH